MQGSSISYSRTLPWSRSHSSPGCDPQALGNASQLFDDVYLHLKKFSRAAVGPGSLVASQVAFAAVLKWSSQQICSSQEIFNSFA